mmetsp:Transcript_9298/g.25201  ORF Transcript_9298/g.25201 Transcript_9298/m.25201 type:complete len:227 (-) Transcript_9298:275-955(-)
MLLQPALLLLLRRDIPVPHVVHRLDVGDCLKVGRLLRLPQRFAHGWGFQCGLDAGVVLPEEVPRAAHHKDGGALGHLQRCPVLLVDEIDGRWCHVDERQQRGDAHAKFATAVKRQIPLVVLDSEDRMVELDEVQHDVCRRTVSHGVMHRRLLELVLNDKTGRVASGQFQQPLELAVLGRRVHLRPAPLFLCRCHPDWQLFSSSKNLLHCARMALVSWRQLLMISQM